MSLTSFIQILIYYLLEVSLIIFIAMHFFLKKKKLQDKNNAFLLYKNYDIEN